MKKRTKLILLISFILIIVVLAVFIIKNKTNKDSVETYNTLEYKFLNCLSTCPIVEKENRSIFDILCSDNCSSYIKVFDKAPISITDNRLIMQSQEYLTCLEFAKTYDWIDYKSCITTLLPKLKEKYPYLK